MIKVLFLVLVILLAIFFIFPTYWMVISSFTDQTRTLNVPPDFWPTKGNLKNYFDLFVEFPILRWMANSAIVALSTLAIGVGTSCLAGYAFAKKEFVGKNMLFWLLMSTLMIPFYSVIVPLFITMRSMNLMNTYPGIFLPLTCNAAHIFLARQYISTLPTELLDAAKIDGASELGIFSHIVIPLSKPLIGALAIFTFVYGWKSFMWPMIVAGKESMKVLPVAVAIAVSYPQVHIEFGLAMAGATMVAIPTLTVFVFFQKYFIKGITMGGVKG